MSVQRLFVKRQHGGAMETASQLVLHPDEGVLGGVATGPLRHVLLLPARLLQDLGIAPGALRETVVLDLDGIHDLPSGTELQVGDARVRLTFHCEPCKQVAPFAKPADLVHRRGYLGAVSGDGTVRVGDPVRVLGQPFEPIPYAPRERLGWYLERHDGAVDASRLLWEVGLPKSYARALPALLKKLPDALRERVRFQRDRGRGGSSGYS